MASPISVTLPREDRERLTRLALSYGLSLKDFSRRILQGISSDIGAESFADYTNPRALKASFRHALRDWRTGRIRTRL